MDTCFRVIETFVLSVSWRMLILFGTQGHLVLLRVKSLFVQQIANKRLTHQIFGIPPLNRN